MTLISIILVVILERTLGVSKYFHYHYYFKKYLHFFENKIGYQKKWQAELYILIWLAIPFLIPVLLLWMTSGGLNWIISTLILFMAFGCPKHRKNYKAYIEAASQGDKQACLYFSLQLGMNKPTPEHIPDSTRVPVAEADKEVDKKAAQDVVAANKIIAETTPKTTSDTTSDTGTETVVKSEVTAEIIAETPETAQNMPNQSQTESVKANSPKSVVQTSSCDTLGQALVWLNYSHYIAVVCWFVLLGAPGAILYVFTRNLATLSQNKSELGLFEQTSRRLLHILDYAPVRIAGFSLLIVGHFSKALPTWLAGLAQLQLNAQTYLIKITRQSEIVDCPQNDLMTEPFTRVKLAKRSFLCIVCGIAVLTIAGVV